MGERVRRQVKPPKKYEESGEEAPAKGKKYVLRLLTENDITQSLLGRHLYLLWPDDGLWYPAEIQKVDVSTQRADVVYLTTDEEESISLSEMVTDQSIAFRDAHPQSYRLKANELLDKEERPEASQSVSRGSRALPEPQEETSGQEESEGQLEAESSPQVSSDEEDEIPIGRRRSTGSGGGPGNEGSSDDLTLVHSGSKRRRVTKAGEPDTPSARPRRQITLSSKAQELLSVERQAQLEAILQRRQSNGQEIAPESPLATLLENPSKDEFASAEEYEQKLLSLISGGAGGSLPKSNSVRRTDSLKGQVSNLSASAKEVREKAVEQISHALEKVGQEANADSLPNAFKTAEAVEAALFALYGEVGKDYKAKYRSLIFNLRDTANPDLRRRVLLAEIPPDKLVRYSANELASKQLSQWREEKEKEAMKAAVLDTQAAAKFSTAAALASKQSGLRARVDWRDNTLATNSPPRDGQRIREVSPEFAADEQPGHSDGEKLDERDDRPAPDLPAQASADGSGLPKLDSLRSSVSEKAAAELPSTSSLDSKSTAIKTGSSFNWSSIRANALQEWDSSTAEQAADAEDQEEYQPEEMLMDDDTDHKDEAAARFSIAESQGLREQVWHGVLGNACPVPLPITVEYVAGIAGLASLLPPRQMDVKGRVRLEKAEEFMLGLKTSRTRSLSLGLIRLTTDASKDERAQLGELIKQYIAKQRCGVVPLGETELYFIAQGQLATGLLRACNGGVAKLAELPSDSVLLVFVHRKNLKALEVRSPRKGRAASKSPAHRHSQHESQRKQPPGQTPALQPQPTPASPGSPAPPPPATELSQARDVAVPSQAPAEPVGDPRVPQAGAGNAGEVQRPSGPALTPAALSKLPQGLDLSSLGSLAAVLGVSQGLNLQVGNQQGLHSQGLAAGSQRITEAPRAPPQPAQQHPALPQQLPNSFPQVQQPSLSLPPPPQSQQQPMPPAQWGGQPAPFALPPPPGFRPQFQVPNAGAHPMQQQQRPPEHHRGGQGVLHQQQQQQQQASQPRPITLPPPGPRPITLHPPGPPGWRGPNRR